MTHGELARRLDQAPDVASVQKLLADLDRDFESDDAFWRQVERVERPGATQADVDRLKRMVRLRALAERKADDPKGDPAAEVGKIKANPTFMDPGQSKSSNWTAKPFERLGDWLDRFFRRPPPDLPAAAPPSGFGQVLVVVVWVLLGAAVVAFLIWAGKTFSWRIAKRKRKIAAGMLEEDEPERTADEWLDQADELERQGRFREAVRCLYLACLVRLDEANVARFIRSETNWEHLHRIHASPRRPAGFDFTQPTRTFDIVWYGHVTRGQPDVAEFREIYTNLCDLLQLRRSA